MVIKVDFDLTMTILAHNLYKLLAMQLDRYAHLSDISIYEKFIMNSGEIEIQNKEINLKFKKKKNLPLMLSVMKQFDLIKYPWAEDKKMDFTGLAIS